jgi:hypothetical protein
MLKGDLEDPHGSAALGVGGGAQSISGPSILEVVITREARLTIYGSALRNLAF